MKSKVKKQNTLSKKVKLYTFFRSKEKLVNIIKDQDNYPYVRKDAVNALKKIAKNGWESFLIDHLKNTRGDENVQREMVKILSETKDSSLFDHFIEIYKNSLDYQSRYESSIEEFLRHDLILALGEFGNKRATKVMLEYLEKECRDHLDKASVVKAIGKQKDKESVPYLIKLLEYTESYRSNKSGAIENEIIYALAEIGDRQSVETVVKWLFNNLGFSQTSTWCYEGFSKTMVDWKPFKASKLFGRYAKLIKDLCSPTKNFVATERLCKINSNISSNLLHQIIERKDVKLTTISSAWEFAQDMSSTSAETVKFDKQIKIAKTELQRRGNPPFNSAFYLEESEWKSY